jgi:hypothetical protein
MNIRFVRINRVSVAIVIFLIIMSIIHIVKPTLFYNDIGGFRPFGLGYRHKTVVPIWTASITIAIMSYLAVIYYITYL